jgi:aminoglycoside phosphotransferase (APT) family kinase protein
MALTLFPHDPALPGLESALRPEVMTAALTDVLPECREEGLRIAQLKITPVRYRPNRRCTLRLDLRTRDAHGVPSTRTLFGKVYHDEAKATSVYAEMQMLAEATSRRPGGVAVAVPAGFLPELLVVLQRPVSGTPLIEFFGRPEEASSNHDRRSHQGVVQAAGALAELQELGVASERERPPDAELRKMGSRARGIALVDLGLGTRMQELVDELSRQLESLIEWGAEKGIVQGDCKPDQFLIRGSTTTLLDFDHCGMADPATDVATFLATFRQLRIKYSLKSPRHRAALERSGWLEGLDSTFLDRYCAVHGDEEDFRTRTIWYEAQALLRKAQRGFARSIRSPLPAALVDEAWRCLSALPSRGAMAR